MARHQIYFALKLHHLNIGSTLTSLGYLTGDLEDAIKARQKELDARFEELEKELQGEAYNAFNVLEDEIEQHYQFNPKVMFSSMFLQMYSFFEFQLVGISNTISKYSSEKFDVPKADVLKNCNAYLRRFINLESPSRMWNEILLIRDLRNILVHENGILNDKYKAKSSFNVLLKKGHIEIEPIFNQGQIKNRGFLDQMLLNMQEYLIGICTLLNDSTTLKSKLIPL